MKDPYQVLGVPQSATDEEITTAYRNRAWCANRQFHAPVGKRIPDTVEHFLKDKKFDIIKMAIKINDHLPCTFWPDNIIHCDS